MYDVRGRTILVTGGSRGLGLELARQLAQRGAHAIICARDQEELAQAQALLAREHLFVGTVSCDIADREQVEEMVSEILSGWGEIDVVINNAGTIQVGPLETMTHEDYEEALQIHLYGPLHVIEAVLPQMRRHQQGRIVNVSSIGGRISVPHLLPYSASKFALVGYSLGLRSELGKEGITVTTVCPGLMRTGSPRNAWFKGQHRAEYAWFKISDSLPVVSMNVQMAAQHTIRALQHGGGLVVLGTPANIAEKFGSLFPGMTADLLAVVNRILPSNGGIGRQRRRGHDSESGWSESWLTALTQRAARQQNQH